MGEPGNGNVVQVANGDNNKLNIELNQQYKKIMRLEHQIDMLRMQIEHLKKEIALKDEIIKLLKEK